MVTSHGGSIDFMPRRSRASGNGGPPFRLELDWSGRYFARMPGAARSERCGSMAPAVRQRPVVRPSTWYPMFIIEKDSCTSAISSCEHVAAPNNVPVQVPARTS